MASSVVSDDQKHSITFNVQDNSEKSDSSNDEIEDERTDHLNKVKPVSLLNIFSSLSNNF